LGLHAGYWNTSPKLCQLSYAVRSVRVCDISELSLVPSISMQSSSMTFSVLVLCTQMNMMFVMLLWHQFRNITYSKRPDRELWACIPKVVYRFDSHSGHAYSSSLSGVDIHSE
jgi:hypothetical protein